MRLTITLMIASAMAGAFFMHQHHTVKIQAAEIERRQATDNASAVIRELSKDYYALYQDVNSREPVVITERVLVKASCPVQLPADASVGDGTNADRVELDSGTVRSVAGVTDKHAKLYEQCAVKLRFLQNAIAPK